MNVIQAQRRDLARLHRTAALTSAVRQAVEIDLDLAEITVAKLPWRATDRA